nr:MULTISPECIES: FkbM family methyltransferase [unclassified Leptolyngbya]
MSPHIILDGTWEPWITALVKDLVKPGMRVLEVGSNCGWYTLLMAQGIGPEGRLITFEANPGLAQLTFDSLNINGYSDRVRLHNLAASNADGEATFRIFERHLGGGTLGAVGQEHLDRFQETIKEITVPTVALDEFLEGGDRIIDLMKIDAEGAEPMVFQGMHNLLKENENLTILMEYSFSQIKNCGFKPVAEMGALFDLGFKAFRIATTQQLIPVNLAELSKLRHCELLLTRDEQKLPGL